MLLEVWLVIKQYDLRLENGMRLKILRVYYIKPSCSNLRKA